MDATRFDHLTRTFGALISRRRSLGLLVALGLGVAFDEVEAKKRRRKKKKQKSTCKATKLPGGGASHATQTTFKGQVLRVEQSEQPFGPRGTTSGQMELTLGGAPLLAFDTEIAGGNVTVTLTYGDVFAGIDQASFTNDGDTIRGWVDGRAIEPLPADADPENARFADGGPPPDIQVDRDLVQAIRAILEKAKNETTGCRTRRTRAGSEEAAKRRGRGVGAEDVDPTIQPACLLLLGACQTGWVGCQFSVGVGCLSATIAYGICFAAGSFGCIVAQEGCRRLARHNPPCCPVRCGGDAVLELWGDDPSCCVKGETCLDADSNRSTCCIEGTRPCHRRSCCFDDQDCENDGICCQRGYSSCGGVCCPDGSCLDGSCCAPPSGVACGGTCCPPFTRSCCNNACCDADCVDNRICCRPPNEPCGRNCCAPGKCCNGVCCGSDETCQNNVCRQVCSPTIHETCPNLPGYAACCQKGAFCCPSGECCPRFAPTCCGDSCCVVGEECCPDNVCRTNCLR